MTVAIVDQEGNTIEVGSDSGPGNGYATTNRFSQPGSAYNNVTVVENGVAIRQIEDGSQRQGSQAEGFLWKPVADSGGMLVILTGQSDETEEEQSDSLLPQPEVAPEGTQSAYAQNIDRGDAANAALNSLLGRGQ